MPEPSFFYHKFRIRSLLLLSFPPSLLLSLLLTHNASLGMLEERDDVLNLRAIGHLSLNLIDDIEHAGFSMKQQTVGIGYMLLHFLVDTG